MSLKFSILNTARRRPHPLRGPASVPSVATRIPPFNPTAYIWSIRTESSNTKREDPFFRQIRELVSAHQVFEDAGGHSTLKVFRFLMSQGDSANPSTKNEIFRLTKLSLQPLLQYEMKLKALMDSERVRLYGVDPGLREKSAFQQKKIALKGIFEAVNEDVESAKPVLKPSEHEDMAVIIQLATRRLNRRWTVKMMLILTGGALGIKAVERLFK